MTTNGKGALGGSFLEEERIDANAGDLGEAMNHSRLPGVGQQLKLGPRQAEVRGKPQKAVGSRASELFSHIPPWGMLGASDQPPAQLSPQQLHLAGSYLFSTLESS